MNKKKDDLTMDLFHHDDTDYPLPNARRTDPETSHMAAVDAKMSMSRGRFLVLHFLYQRDMIDHELAEASGLQHNSIGKRRGDCVTAGYVTARRDDRGIKLKRPAPSGSMAIVWGITPKGEGRYLDEIAAGVTP